MSNLNESMTKAIGLINNAIRHEENNEYDMAIDQYKKGLAVFSLIAKNKQNGHIKETLVKYMTTYKQRAEELQEELTNPKTQKTKKSVTRKNNNNNSPPISQSQQQQQPRKIVENNYDDDDDDDEDDEDGKNQYSNKRLKNLPDVTFDDIVGLKEIKDLLIETTTLPYEMAHLFTGNRKPAQSILLYGPPGNGKTELARALAGTSGMNFYPISSSDIISKYVGESEKNIKELFDEVKMNTPCILFIDELDSVCTKRIDSASGGGGGGGTKALQQFLVQLDGICEKKLDGVLLLGATNLPWDLDSAMLRRFSHRIFVPMPSKEARRMIFEKYISKNEHSIESIELQYLSFVTDYYSASDIANVCRMAAMEPVKRVKLSDYFHHHKESDVYYPCNRRRRRPGMNEIVYCSSSEANCIERSYSGFEDKSRLRAGPILYSDVVYALGHIKSSIDLEQLRKIEEWSLKK